MIALFVSTVTLGATGSSIRGTWGVDKGGKALYFVPKNVSFGY